MNPHVEAFLARFLDLGPLWLLAYLALSVYVVDYGLSYQHLISSPSNDLGFGNPTSDSKAVTAGFVFIIISTILKVTWFGAWIQCLVITWCCDRKWKSPSPSKIIMQADDTAWGLASGGILFPYHEGHLPRKCPKGCPFGLSDRVYHCTHLGRCLPLYDHYCSYLKVAVYLRTIKPYMYAILFLPLDAIFSISVSIAALVQYKVILAHHVGLLIMGAIMIALAAFNHTVAQFNRLGMRNVTTPETNQHQLHLAFKINQGGQWQLHLFTFHHKRPWDIGTSENLHQLFGKHWWQWFFFFCSPERVSRYGNYHGSDLPYAQFVHDHRTSLLMPLLSSIAVKAEPGPSSIHEQEPSPLQHELTSITRREQQRSAVSSRRSQHRSSGLSVTQAAEPTLRQPRRNF
ncbi:hypothetical protein F4778DRAFT_166989 [Xylariomycetidae sp. FL2044]|nr:hypothetical protein F4778DRAFT_166989 [Xylariomycetidae sp. FL2044]